MSSLGAIACTAILPKLGAIATPRPFANFLHVQAEQVLFVCHSPLLVPPYISSSLFDLPRVMSDFGQVMQVIGQVSQRGQDTIVWGGPGLFPPITAGKRFSSPIIYLAGERWSLEIEPSFPQKGCLILRRHGGALPSEPAKTFDCTVLVESVGADEEEEVYSCVHFGEKCVISEHSSLLQILTITLLLTEGEPVLQVPSAPCSSPRRDCDDVIGQVSQRGQDTIVWDGPGFSRPITAGERFCSPTIHLAGKRWSLEIESFFPYKCRLVLRRHDTEPAKKFHFKVVVKSVDGKEQVYSCVHFGERHLISDSISLEILAITVCLSEGGPASQDVLPYSEGSSIPETDETSDEFELLPLDDDKFSKKPNDEMSINISDKLSSSDESELFGSRKEANGFGSNISEFKSQEKDIQRTAVDSQPAKLKSQEKNIQRTAVDSQPAKLKLPQVLPVPKLQEKKEGPFCTTFKSCERETEVFDIESGQLIEDKSDDCRCSEAKGVMLLTKHMNDLLKKGDDFDVRFHVQDRELAAHRNIVKARCPVFCTMLTHDTQEKKSGIIRIEDCDADAFGIFLVYLYTGKAKGLTPKKALDLYYIANKYDLSELKEKCVAFLERDLSKTTVCDAILLSTKHDDSELLEAAKNFFIQNAEEILVTAEWQNFMAKHPAEANELYIEVLNASKNCCAKDHDSHSTDSSRTSQACEPVPSYSNVIHLLQMKIIAEQEREQRELIYPSSSSVLGRSRSPKRKSCTTNVPESMPMNAASNDVTVIGHSYGRHSVPYLNKLPGKNITLKQFKSLLSKTGNFKYLFKTASKDFVEVTDDCTILPLWEDKVFCLIESMDDNVVVM